MKIDLKKEADKLMKIKGGTKGSEFLTLKNYILQKHGKEKVLLLERKMAELGYPLDFDKINIMEWYSESLNVLAMIVAKHLFGWENLFEFGYNSPKFSFGIRLLVKFISLERLFKEASKIWRKFLDVGTLEPREFNRKEKYSIIRLKDYKFHPDSCLYYAGYFLRICKYTQRSKKMTIEETKCMFRGDPYHEYLIRWE